MYVSVSVAGCLVRMIRGRSWRRPKDFVSSTRENIPTTSISPGGGKLQRRAAGVRPPPEGVEAVKDHHRLPTDILIPTGWSSGKIFAFLSFYQWIDKNFRLILRGWDRQGLIHFHSSTFLSFEVFWLLRKFKFDFLLEKKKEHFSIKRM